MNTAMILQATCHDQLVVAASINIPKVHNNICYLICDLDERKELCCEATSEVLKANED